MRSKDSEAKIIIIHNKQYRLSIINQNKNKSKMEEIHKQNSTQFCSQGTILTNFKNCVRFLV